MNESLLREALNSLTFLRAVLSGEIATEQLPKVGNSEGQSRRLIALEVVDGLGQRLYEEQLRLTEKRSPYGFAAGRAG